jgi:uncharacterized protein YjdB
MQNTKKYNRVMPVFTLACCLALAACNTSIEGNSSKDIPPIDGNPSPSKIVVTGVSLNKSVLSLHVGDTETLIATITPADATNQGVEWASSYLSVATVSQDGTINAIKAGSTVISVVSVDGGKKAACNVTVTARMQNEVIPHAPTNVKASATGLSIVNLTWTSVSGASGYRVYRSTSATGTYTHLDTVLSPSYTNTGVVPDTTYYYRISAYNSAGESAMSEFAEATTSVSSTGGPGIRPGS